MTQGARVKLANLLRELRPDWTWDDIDSALLSAEVSQIPVEYVFLSAAHLARRMHATPSHIPTDAKARWRVEKRTDLTELSATA